MNWIELFSFLIFAGLFSAASLLVTKFWIRNKQVDCEKDHNRRTKIILSFILGITLFSSFLVIKDQGNHIGLAHDLSVLFVMSMVAFSDVLTGRIPLFTLLISAVLGIGFGLIGTNLWAYLLGGMINFLLGVLMFSGGQRYMHNKFQGEETRIAFGWGDVYACGALGFLIGFPFGFFALVLALLIALGSALIEALLRKTPFLKSRLKLGFFFYLSAIVMIRAINAF